MSNVSTDADATSSSMKIDMAESGARRGMTRRATVEDVLAALILVAHAPLLLTHFQNLWLRPHYQFFPMVLFGAGGLLWSRWPHHGTRASGRRFVWAWMFLAASVLLLGTATALFSPWLAAISALVALVALLCFRADEAESLRKLLAAWAVLWLAVPPPFGWDEQVVLWLKGFTSRTASQILDLGGINHLMAGNVLELPGRRYLVEEACSGIHSLLALLACTALFCAWARRSCVHSLLLIASAVLWAIPANVARVTAIAVADVKMGIDLSTGWMHEVLGFTLIAAALAMIACTDRMLTYLLAPIEFPNTDQGLFEDDDDHEDLPDFDKLAPALPGTVGNPLSRFWNRLVQADDGSRRFVAAHASPSADDSAAARSPRVLRWSLWGLAGTAACLGLLQAALLIRSYEGRVHIDQALAAMNQSSLPAELHDWRQTDYSTAERERTSEFGAFSKLWTYEPNAVPVVVSFDYPFLGWHDLSICYRGQGWEVLERTVAFPSSTERTAHAGADDPSGPHDAASHSWCYIEFELVKPSGEHAYVLYSMFDGAARPLNPAEATQLSSWERLKFRLGTGPLWRVLRDRGIAAYGSDATAYQVQAFAQTGSRLTDEQRREIRSGFLQFRDTLRQQLADSTNAGGRHDR